MATPDPFVRDLMDFIGGSPTPFHAVAMAVARLEAAGFRPRMLHEEWQVGPGRHYVVHGETTLVAWVQPHGAVKGFRLVGAHTDSPNLRLRPRAAVTREGYQQVGVEVYGSPLLNSWLDRDLSLAGRVLVRDRATLASHLVAFDRPMLRIPQLAIHLDREVNDRGLKLDKQKELLPVLGLDEDGSTFDIEGACAEELGIAPDSIVTVDLMVYDVVPPAVGGARNEFLFAARLDNLAMSHAGIAALVEAAPAADDGLVPFLALFDHEEVGSHSATGAGSAFLPQVLERIALAEGGSRESYLRALASSFFLSADMSHAVHPNYADRHDAQHKVKMNGGPVIKVNAQQRYATSAASAALFSEICREVEVSVQYYSHRNDIPCGSTIGPIVSTHLGVRTVDVGNAMLSMHSAREMTGVLDPARMTRVMARFFTRRDTVAGL